MTKAKGASTEPALTVIGDRTLLAWSEAQGGRNQGDIFLATIETASLHVLDPVGGREL